MLVLLLRNSASLSFQIYRSNFWIKGWISMSVMLDVVFHGNKTLSVFMQNMFILCKVLMLKVSCQLNVSCKYRKMCITESLRRSAHLAIFYCYLLRPFTNLSWTIICSSILQKSFLRTFFLFHANVFFKNIYK